MVKSVNPNEASIWYAQVKLDFDFSLKRVAFYVLCDLARDFLCTFCNSLVNILFQQLKRTSIRKVRFKFLWQQRDRIKKVKISQI